MTEDRRGDTDGSPAPCEQLPSVSVVMPVRNEASSIARSLGSILDQDYPSDLMDVVVADGMSTDGTREVIATLVAQRSDAAPVRVIDNERGIVPTGLNAAIAQGRGDIIIRADGHSEFPSDYVRRCVGTLLATGADNAGGVVVAEGRSAAARAIAAVVSSPFGVGNARFRTGGRPGWVDTVPFGAWRRGVFDRIGGFDEELVRNQDDEHNFRLIQSGGRIWLDPTIRIAYESRASFESLATQYFQYGVYKVRVMQKRRSVATVRQLVPPAFVAALAGSSAVGLGTRRARWVVAVVGPYLAGVALATARTRPPDLATAVRTPVAFATVHLSYGSGYLAGLWRWRGHFRDMRDGGRTE